jgi:hypothetical protein
VNRVLFVTYHFPPVGGAGVQRSVKFVRYLEQFGWLPVVLTGPGLTASRWTPSDPSLAGDVSASVEVIRIGEQPPPPSTGVRRRAERFLRIPTPFARWWIEAGVSTGSSVDDVDVVYASMSPFESADTAARLSRRIGKPWVADLRDPWALDEMVVYPTALHRRLELRTMRRLLSSASAVIMNTEEAARALVDGVPELDGRRVFTIPNGFDSADFAGPPSVRTDGRFRIVHAGYLHTELARGSASGSILRRALGGATSGVDFLARSHVFLLRAVNRLLEDTPSLRDRLEIVLAGVLSPEDRDVVAHEAAYPELVTATGYLPHHETVSLLRSAELLFLPMHGLPAGRRARIVPGKTYEYLASRRPILAAVPDGDARDLLTAAGARLCRPTDESCMARVIREELERFERGEAAPAVPERLLERFERRKLTADLAAVLDEVHGHASYGVQGAAEAC